LGFCGVRKVY